MRNFNKLVILSLVIYAVLAVFAAGVIQTRQDGRGQSYKVEINRIMGEIEAGMTGTEKVTDVSESWIGLTCAHIRLSRQLCIFLFPGQTGRRQ